jgi:DNA-binding transcriptional regulator YiaG
MRTPDDDGYDFRAANLDAWQTTMLATMPMSNPAPPRTRLLREAAEGLSIRTEGVALTPADLSTWRADLGLTQQAAASALGVTLTTYQQMERGASYATGKLDGELIAGRHWPARRFEPGSRRRGPRHDQAEDHAARTGLVLPTAMPAQKRAGTFGISTRTHGAPGLVNLQKQGLRHYSSIYKQVPF